MPDPIPTQEQLDKARAGYMEQWQRRRLNLASRLILSVCGPYVIFTFFDAIAGQAMLRQVREISRGLLSANPSGTPLGVNWMLWVKPLAALLSTFVLLYLWRKPLNPEPIVLPSAGQPGPSRAERLKSSAGEQLSGFQGFVKSLFI